jgi:hypothetical protein
MKRFAASSRWVVASVALVFGLVAIAAVAEEAAKTVTPFNGKDLTGWKLRGAKEKSQWVVGTAKLDPNEPRKLVVTEEGSELINKSGGVDIFTEEKFGDCILKIDVMVPKGANSGIYLMGAYEVQVLDSFGKEKDFSPGDMGGIYNAAAPKDPKYKAPGEWQSFEMHFIAPKFDADGKKTANAKFVKIVHNGVVIHENVELTGPTRSGGPEQEKAAGPLRFQGDHGPVAYRNLRVAKLTP